MSNTNIANQKIRWFNAHTEACGYLNGFKEVLPTAGQAFKPFWASTFCLLEGNPESPRKTYVSVSIANPKVVELLAPFSDQLNAEESRVFVTARLADLSAEPFVFGANSQRAGHLGVNWKGKLLMLLALKIGDMTIDLKREATTDFNVKASQTATPKHPVPSGKNVFDVPLLVSLDLNEPNFEESRARLKDSGYRWNKDRSVWFLANISLAKTDLAFNEKHNTLIEAGYVFANNVWNLPASPKQQGFRQASTSSQRPIHG